MLGVDDLLVKLLILLVVVVRIDHCLSLHLLVKEHLIGRPEISLVEIILVRAVAEEEVASLAFAGVWRMRTRAYSDCR